MFRLITGLVKGLVIGGGVGYGLVRIGAENVTWVYLACAAVGALVGIVCGQPPWKSETIWTPIVKMVIGGLIGGGLCALGRNVLPDASLVTLGAVEVGMHSGPFLATAVGALYGAFVEVDDGGAKPQATPSQHNKDKG